MFRKLLIANRGEIAVRVFRACRELGIKTVAVYSDADKDAIHARYADEAVHIGPAAPSESYLQLDKIVKLAADHGAEAIHPGYGFLSERPQFPEACAARGIVFTGPPAAPRSTSRSTWPSRATSRSRSSPTATATPSIWASASARSSAGTRRSSRRPLRRQSRRTSADGWERPPSRPSRPPAMSTRARS